jgi:hypothetical protein
MSTGYNRDTTKPDHNCTQGATMAMICEKLENLEKTIADIKSDQKEQLEKLESIQLSLAARPDAKLLQKTIAKVNAHDIYFGLMGIALGFIIGWLTGAIDRFFLG